MGRGGRQGPEAPRPEQGLLGIRKALGLYANLRPVKPSPALIGSSPLKEDRIAGTDLLVVRELTGGIYFGDSGRRDDNGGTAYDECAYSVAEIERITRAAFEAAEAAGGRPRRRTASHLGRQGERDSSLRGSGGRRSRSSPADYPDVELDHMLVDNTAMQLVSRPTDFDVIVTENLFGDILSDEAAMLTGSLGMLPSASIGAEGEPGLFEPVHGSAPDIAGQGVANPLATMLSAAMMLRYGLVMPAEADRIESAVDAVLASGLRSPDLFTGAEGEREAGTAEVTAAVLAELA